MKRRENEDNFAVDRKIGLFLVADGMGGHAAGEVASKMAIDLVVDYLRRTRESDEPYLTGFNTKYSRAGNRLNSAIILANQIISDSACNRKEWDGMGTTIVAAWLPNPSSPKLTIAHVGDSRAYLLRSGDLIQLTRDHSVVEEQLREGLISREEASTSAIRNMITRALGYRNRVDVEITELDVEPGDKLLLCSDGLNTMLTDEEIMTVIHMTPNIERACKKLITEANRQGGKDNITVIMASFL
ncbi:MAG: Stp1/IreP family PP2C-type Ser/Thr phosphatase [Proteobacteria bacterium]|nr:Stp1/IreP family PP2C-type Ser/Thr phosphatase [Pseudomonadota bacterium]MBU1687778.1 Stp1/IreP family PP2C-type Ser/Thr phosphatase [Pseudomonadota bacterium]